MHFAGLYVRSGRDRVPPRRLRAVGQAPQGRADDAAAAVRGAGSRSTSANSRKFWRSVRDAAPFWHNGSVGDWPLWRVSTTPARGAEFASKLPPGAQLFYDWAGGLIWIALPPSAQRRRRNDPPRRGGDRRPRHAHSRLRRHPRRGRRVRAAAGRARRRHQARQGELRSQGRAQPRPHVGGGVMQTSFSLTQLADPDIAVADTISCAPACIAASARRPARPMCCSATSSIRRAGAST